MSILIINDVSNWPKQFVNVRLGDITDFYIISVLVPLIVWSIFRLRLLYRRLQQERSRVFFS